MNNFSTEEGYRAAQVMLSKPDRPTAVFVASDILACGVLQFLYENNIKIPQDISIIGYDDTYSSFTSPQLTTISVLYDEIGKSVVEILKNMNTDHEVRVINIHPQLIERNTVLRLI